MPAIPPYFDGKLPERYGDYVLKWTDPNMSVPWYDYNPIKES